jgi:membrane associated rhomboid family serine protease
MEQNWQPESEEAEEKRPRTKWPRSFLVILVANVFVFVWVNYLSVTWSGVSQRTSTRSSSGATADGIARPAVSTAPVGEGAYTRSSQAEDKGGEDAIVRTWRDRVALAEENALASFAPWMLVSHQLLHSGSIWLALGMLVVWWLAALLERVWTWRQVLLYYMCCGAGVCVCSLAVNASHLGGSVGASLGMMFAVARIHGTELRLFGRMKLATLFLLAVIVLFVVGMCQGNASAVLGYWAQGGGALAGFAFLRLEPVVGRLLASWRVRTEHRRKLQKAAVSRKVDMLLDRIARHGMKSLSRSERSFLRRASKLYRAHKSE